MSTQPLPVADPELDRILFCVQEVLPYARAEGKHTWNQGVEALIKDVHGLRHRLGLTDGPGDKPEPRTTP